MKIFRSFVLCSITAFLVACGGGGGGGAAPANTPGPVSFFNDPVQIDSSTFTNSAVGDFDGDGDEDLVVTFYGSDPGNDNLQPWTGVAIKIFLQNASGNLVDSTNSMLSSVPTIALARHIEVADFNGDGADDIYFGNHGLELGTPLASNWYEQDVLLLSNGSGTFHNDAMTTNMPQLNVSGVGLTHGWYTHGVDSADIDNDGDIDLVVNGSWIDMTVFVNDGNGVFTVDSTHTIANMWVQFIKADNDIYPDLYVGNAQTPSENVIKLNDGSGNFTAGNIVMPTPLLGRAIEEAHVADVNGDGREDLIIGNTGTGFTDHKVQVLINDYDTSASFVDETTTRYPDPVVFANNYNPKFAVRDMDNDGYSDLIIVKKNNITYESEVGVYRNNNFVLDRITTLTGLSQEFALIDLGNDGLIDVVESDGSGMYVYKVNATLTN